MTRSDDMAVKRARVREFLERHDLGGVLFTLQKSFAWYTAGGQNHVALTTENGVASVLATPTQDYLLTNNIEAERLMQEEGLDALGVQAIAYRWDSDELEQANLLDRVIAGEKYTTDTGPYASEINELRYSLTPFEVERYRALGKDCGEVIESVARAIEPGQTEWQIAGQLSAALYDRKIVPAVALVAVDDRIRKYRHPIPTGKRLENCAMLVICGRRHGLIVSVTRMVHFGTVPSDLRERHNACMEVDATYIANTVVGTDVNEIVERAVDTYEEAGYEGEWMLHHQGGGTGYDTRDFKGTLHSRQIVQPWQAYAWNPSVTGTKTEDTMIATPDGPQIISLTSGWPTVEFNAPGMAPSIRRPDILVR